ncbi:nuclear transport factor 2 family protein [bacterium]|nr:nuclear transport factor 2 family protein [bacterium]
MSDENSNSAAVEAEHQALRAMRDTFVAAYNQGDIEGMLAVLDENVSFTAMNGEVCHGHADVRNYHEKLRMGSRPVVKSTSVDAIEADRLTVLYGDSFGVATGWADTSYKLADGLVFSCRLRWSNTMTKHSGTWKIASFHTSSNLFDNPILALSKKAASYTAAATAAVGLAVGGALGWFLRRR